MTMATRLLHLLGHQWLTPLDALQTCGCMSLAQRVSEFRREGIDIEDRWVDLPSGKRVKAYRLKRAE